MGRGRRAGRSRPAVPRRRCVGCRQVRPQPELFRLVLEEARVAPGKGQPGRGAWLCRNETCARDALRKGEIFRALKRKVAAPPLASLLEWMGLSLA